eukprot:3890472-Amphidinium_carterae.3
MNSSSVILARAAQWVTVDPAIRPLRSQACCKSFPTCSRNSMMSLVVQSFSPAATSAETNSECGLGAGRLLLACLRLNFSAAWWVKRTKNSHCSRGVCSRASLALLLASEVAFAWYSREGTKNNHCSPSWCMLALMVALPASEDYCLLELSAWHSEDLYGTVQVVAGEDA